MNHPGFLFASALSYPREGLPSAPRHPFPFHEAIFYNKTATREPVTVKLFKKKERKRIDDVIKGVNDWQVKCSHPQHSWCLPLQIRMSTWFYILYRDCNRDFLSFKMLECHQLMLMLFQIDSVAEYRKLWIISQGIQRQLRTIRSYILSVLSLF